jgi:hypothetical protein
MIKTDVRKLDSIYPSQAIPKYWFFAAISHIAGDTQLVASKMGKIKQGKRIYENRRYKA